MKSKLLSFVLSLAFLMLACSAFTSALTVSVISSTFPQNVTHNQGSTTFTVNVTNDNDTYSAVNVNAYADSNLGTVSISSIPSLPANSSQLVTATITFPSYNSGLISITNIRANATVNGTLTTSSSVSGPNSITILPSNALSASASSASVGANQNSTITVTNTGNQQLNNLNIYSSNSAVALTRSSISTLNPGNSTTFTAYSNSSTTLTLGNPAASTITINDTDTLASATASVSADAAYCDYGDIGTNLSITDFEISKTDEDYTWMPLQDVEIRFNINNKNANSDDKITAYAEIELYSSTGHRYLNLAKLKVGTINGGDSKLAKFNFTVPVDVKEGTAYLYIKTYQSGKESEICTSQVDSVYKKPITISTESDDDKQIAVTDVTFDSQPAICGTEAIMTARVSNVGDRDQNNVKVSIYNQALGLNSYIVLQDLNQGDYSDISFPITIPSGVVAKTYSLDFKVRYDLTDTNLDSSLDTSYDLVKLYTPTLIVTGTQCNLSSSTAAITGGFSSETPNATIGKLIKFEAVITNTGTSSASYTVDVGNNAWSTLRDINPKTFTLDAGTSKTVEISFDILSNAAAGDRNLTISATSGSVSSATTFAITLQENGSIMGRIWNNILSNPGLYAIILVNLILIIAIILVVRSLMVKP